MNHKIIRVLLGSLAILMLMIGSGCGGGNGSATDVPLPPELPEDVDSLVLLAKFDLTLKTGADIEKVSVASVEETTFSDASLGVSDSGVEYPAVETPGYIILLKYDGDTYEYHASGERVVQVPTE